MALASLGMYDDQYTQEANDQLWQVVSSCIAELDSSIATPSTLNRTTPLAEQWKNPDLLLSQTCGYPYIKFYQNHLQLVATPEYTHHGCEGNRYSSLILVRTDASNELTDYRGKRLAANSANSLSGFVSLEILLNDYDLARPFFSECIFCASHANAVALVAYANADLCCIDAVTFGLLKRLNPSLCSKLKTIDQTRSFPSLPLVTASARPHNEVQILRQALRHALQSNRATAALERLGISDFAVTPHSSYAEILSCYEGIESQPIADTFNQS